MDECSDGTEAQQEPAVMTALTDWPKEPGVIYASDLR